MWILDFHFAVLVSCRHRLRAGTLNCPSINSFSVWKPRKTANETLMNFWRMMMHLSFTGRTWHSTQNKMKYLFLIGSQEAGRVCLVSPPVCLTHTDWVFIVLARPLGHTGLFAEWKKSYQHRERHYAGWWTSFTTQLYVFTLWKCEHFLGRVELSSCNRSCPRDALSLPELFLSHIYNF